MNGGYGGPEGIRTPDLLHAMEALYQLRYKPKQNDSLREQGLLYMIGFTFSIGFGNEFARSRIVIL
jgi:hypothetical protein